MFNGEEFSVEQHLAQLVNNNVPIIIVETIDTLFSKKIYCQVALATICGKIYEAINSPEYANAEPEKKIRMIVGSAARGGVTAVAGCVYDAFKRTLNDLRQENIDPLSPPARYMI